MLFWTPDSALKTAENREARDLVTHDGSLGEYACGFLTSTLLAGLGKCLPQRHGDYVNNLSAGIVGMLLPVTLTCDLILSVCLIIFLLCAYFCCRYKLNDQSIKGPLFMFVHSLGELPFVSAVAPFRLLAGILGELGSGVGAFIGNACPQAAPTP